MTQVYLTNTIGTYLVTAAFIPLLAKAKAANANGALGNVINVLSKEALLKPQVTILLTPPPLPSKYRCARLTFLTAAQLGLRSIRLRCE